MVRRSSSSGRTRCSRTPGASSCSPPPARSCSTSRCPTRAWTETASAFPRRRRSGTSTATGRSRSWSPPSTTGSTSTRCPARAAGACSGRPGARTCCATGWGRARRRTEHLGDAARSMPLSPDYKPAPRFEGLGPAFYDEVVPARFPKLVPRYRNQGWASRIGLGDLTAAEWEAHFGRFEPLLCNLPRPMALRYHGHQFDVYNPHLGDGRGFLFAQVVEAATGRLLDLATKGSGTTPWSRGGDGRLTLKGGVREVLATEMLEASGVSTSKSLSLFETGEALVRR